MEKKTGLKVNGFFASDYAGVIEAMRFNKVQIAWYGNKSAMEAVDRSNGEIFAQTVDKDGNPGYWSHIIVHKASSPFKKLDDILKCDKTLELRHRRSELDLGLPRADDLHLLGQEHRPQGVLQDRAQRQP